MIIFNVSGGCSRVIRVRKRNRQFSPKVLHDDFLTFGNRMVTDSNGCFNLIVIWLARSQCIFVCLQERNAPAFLLFQSSAARAALGSDVSILKSTLEWIQKSAPSLKIFSDVLTLFSETNWSKVAQSPSVAVNGHSCQVASLDSVTSNKAEASWKISGEMLPPIALWFLRINHQADNKFLRWA